MLLSKLLGERYKEKPTDAFLDSHIFMLRGGYIRQVANGVFTLLPPAKRIVRKIEDILREEMDRIDGQEVSFPVTLPAELWSESGRFQSVGSELLRFKDRSGKDMVLGMTHEEAAVHLARTEAKSYTKYPFMIYQIQTKFRDEPRARGGLVRVREFTMKDGYSYHTSQEDLEKYYDVVLDAYNRIFTRLGLTNFISVKSDTGMMGGKIAHEFMYLSEGGEDTLVLCSKCDYKSNMEVAAAKTQPATTTETPLMTVETPDVKTIEQLSEFLKIKPEQTLKSTVFIRADNQKVVVAFVRGDMEVNEAKLKPIVGCEVYPLTDESVDGLCLGFVGPYQLDAGVEVYFDSVLQGEASLVCGGNKADTHFKGLSMKRDCPNAKYHDFGKVREGDACTVCGEPLQIRRGIEIGNIFQLGDKYTKSMGMTYVSESGQLETPVMGCYGIGVGRTFACILENHHDEYGPIWPMAVAPWQIHICMLNNSIEEISTLGFSLYEKLSEKYQVVLDDRSVNAGIQFADADLLGIPLRIVLSKRNIENGEIEISTRDKSIRKTVKVDDIYTEIDEVIKSL